MSVTDRHGLRHADISTAPRYRVAVFHAVREIELSDCDTHEPHTPRPAAIALVESSNRLGNLQRKACCAGCLMDYVETVSRESATGPIVWTRSSNADLDVVPDLGFRPAAPALVVVDSVGGAR